MHIQPILFVLGFMLRILSAAMLLTAAVDLAYDHEDWKIFATASAGTFIVATLMVAASNDDRPVQLTVKDGFLLTTLSWLVMAAFAAVPFRLLGLSLADSYFEAMSGLTTTGSTVIVGLDKLPQGILLWRALLNGVGGLGIIVMAILVMPYLRIGGMQLFRTESSDRTEKFLPRAFELMAATAAVYIALIVACGIVYRALGMSAFDAVCHAMATIATGGFSTHDDSFGFFKSPAIEWAAVVFMMLGAMPLLMLVRAIRGETSVLWRDEQIRGFVGFIAAVCLIVGLWLSATAGIPFLDALRRAAFNIISIVTTTGFASEDYTKWGPFAIGIFLILTFVGGCSGSTAGAMKIYRLQVAGLLIRSHLIRLITPHRIVLLSYNGRPLPDDVPFSVVAFLTVYIMIAGLFTLLLAAMGLDAITALSASAQAIGNVGPGLGDIVGPAGNYATLPEAAKWILAFAMMLGRLEIFTVLVLLRPEFWRR